LAFARLGDVAGVDLVALPVHFALWFPQMAQSAWTWSASLHIWPREFLEAGRVHDAVLLALPARADAAQASVLEQLAKVLRAGKGPQ
jgi:hypothetical protein